MTRVYTENGWKVQETFDGEDTYYEFQQQFTLTGAAQNLDLALNFPIELKKIEYFSDDTTAKSFTEDVYSGTVDTSSYDRICTKTLDTNQSISLDSDNLYMQQPVRIRTAVTASTNTKKLTKKVKVRRLE